MIICKGRCMDSFDFDVVSLGGVVLQQLLDWLRMHFTDGDRFFFEAMQDENPEHHPNFWQAVRKAFALLSQRKEMFCV